jgi:hypothetical protein
MSPLLTVLNDLSWVIECAAMDHMGEGKSELGMLSKRLLSDSAYEIADGKEISTELAQARKAYMAGEMTLGSHKLMTVSRRLWGAVVAEGKELQKDRV